MEDGLLSLKWNNHKSTFFHILSNLRKRESYTDATIACEGRFFPVHKLVMSTCSDYFGDIFERTTCKAPVVILKDIRYQEIESLLDYMYLGEVDVKQSELAGLIKAAECLRIKGLAVPDEDPNSNGTSKRSTHLSDNRSSPSAKRHRRDSDSSDDPHYYTQYSKGQRSHSPLNQSSTSSRSHSTSSTPVPSQIVETETVSHVSSQSMPPPPYSESRRTSHQSSSSHSLSTTEQLDHIDKNEVPVEFIKVEVDEEKVDKSKDKSKASLHTSLKDDARGEGGRCEGIAHEKQHTLSNNYSEYCNNDDDVEKEQEQMEDFNSSEIPGPSGVQGTSQLMGWGEEEGSFPHNLFGTEDASHQQVCIATMDPELVAVRMFQGSKAHVQQIGFHQLQRLQQDETLIQLAQQSGPTKVFLLHEQLAPAQTVEILQKTPRTSLSGKKSSRQIKRRQPQQQIQIVHSEELTDESRSLSEESATLGPSAQLQQILPLSDSSSFQPIQIFNSHYSKADKKAMSILNNLEIRRNEEPPKLLQLQSLDEHSLPITHEKLCMEKQQSDTKSQAHTVCDSNQSSSSQGVVTSPQDLSSRNFRLHECPYCIYSSKSKVDLNKHIRTHTKEKPYKCHICKYESGDRSNYRRHMAGVHKVNDSDLPAELQPRRQSRQEILEMTTEEQLGTSSSMSVSTRIIGNGTLDTNNADKLPSIMQPHQQSKESTVEMAMDERATTNPLSMSVQTIEVIAIPFSEERTQPAVSSPNTA